MLQALRLMCAATAALLPISGMATCAPPLAGPDRWAVAAPEAVGLDSNRLCTLVSWIEGWKESGIHAVLVARHDQLVFEQYFSGADERWGAPLGNDANHSNEQLHDARSVTKSVVALALGIALDHGLVKAGLDTPVLDLLPQYGDLRTPEKGKITLRHLLTMSAGFRWNEDIPYSDPVNSERQMDAAPDPARFVLSQDMMAPPGEIYNYSGGSAVLIQAILKQATGKSLDVLAHELLFAPLGIEQVEWVRYPLTSEPIAASGLRLLPRDFVKLGQLVLQHGAWKGEQIAPSAFMEQATSPQINGQQLYFYGYQFWLGRSFVRGQEIDWSAAVGLGGQRIFIVPALDLVAVVNAGLYRSPMQAWVPLVVLDRYVLAAAH